MKSAVFGRSVWIMYAERRGWGRLSALPSIWNGVRALRASVRGDGKEVAHSWKDGDGNARLRERGRESGRGEDEMEPDTCR